MDQYLAQPLSRLDLRKIAKQIRKKLGLEKVIKFPVLDVLEFFDSNGLEYQVVFDEDLPPNVHAQTDITNKIIYIKNSVYEGAHCGNGRDLMTILHELCHFWLVCLVGVRLQQFKGNRAIKPYESPEWQAKCLAGEIMMDKDLIRGLQLWQVMDECGVSEGAASYQMKIYVKEGY